MATQNQESALDQKVREYKALLDRKEELEDATKANNKAIKETEQLVAQMMIDIEKPSTIVDGFNYSLKQVTNYSKKSEEKLEVLKQEEGIIFFECLREQRLGDLIKETVNARSLQSAMKALAETEEGIPEDLLACLSVYDTIGVGKTKANTKALDRANKSQGGKQ